MGEDMENVQPGYGYDADAAAKMGYDQQQVRRPAAGLRVCRRSRAHRGAVLSRAGKRESRRGSRERVVLLLILGVLDAFDDVKESY